MQNKYLTENSRIADAYMNMYARPLMTNESEGVSVRTLGHAPAGRRVLRGNMPSRTGSKLGPRKILPFEKRDVQPAGYRSGAMSPVLRGRGQKVHKCGMVRKVTNNWISKGGVEFSGGLRDKLAPGKVMPFEKRDSYQTSIGKVRGVKDFSKVSRVRRVRESEEVDDMEDIEVLSDQEGCPDCENRDEVLGLVLTAFDQIYDNLSDDDKETVDEVRGEIEGIINPDEDGGDEDDGDDDEDLGESVVNEGFWGGVGKGFQKTGRAFKQVKRALGRGRGFGYARDVARLIKKADATPGGLTAAEKETLGKYIEAYKKAGGSEEALNDYVKRLTGNKIDFSKGTIKKLTAKEMTALGDEAAKKAAVEELEQNMGQLGHPVGRGVARTAVGAGAAMGAGYGLAGGEEDSGKKETDKKDDDTPDGKKPHNKNTKMTAEEKEKQQYAGTARETPQASRTEDGVSIGSDMSRKIAAEIVNHEEQLRRARGLSDGNGASSSSGGFSLGSILKDAIGGIGALPGQLITGASDAVKGAVGLNTSAMNDREHANRMELEKEKALRDLDYEHAKRMRGLEGGETSNAADVAADGVSAAEPPARKTKPYPAAVAAYEKGLSEPDRPYPSDGGNKTVG